VTSPTQTSRPDLQPPGPATPTPTATDATVNPSLTRRPVFWIFVALLAIASITFSVRNFTAAFPVASVELAMDRAGALDAARELADAQGWGPEGFRQAASFSDPDPAVRVYLELELGEDDAIGRLLEAGDYHAYRWQIRHFREGETREALVRFTPAGAPYGFRLTLPEDEPGPALTPAEARSVAESAASSDWEIDFTLYQLVESSQETRPSDRVDHTLIYEHTAASLGDADLRLRLRVSGDELTELTHTVRVPEAFGLRYQEMRTANTRLALIASLLFLGLFFVVGCGLGLFHLVRIRWLEWKTPLAWGGLVASVMALAILNDLPLAWMEYDTAVAPSFFLVEIFVIVGLTLVVGTALLALIFMVAESLGRRAFPDQPQQWRFWHPEVARSGPVIGRTLGGYAVAAIEIGFVIAFYLWATRREGWWMPSDILVHPDLVASYAPWLTAVSMALFSGFWEESLFRAIPIAGAALIGARYGGRRWWILAALILQAAVFAAAHADYPQQPSYARLAELFLPALFWGVLYIWFGLVPVILAHASYNLTLISIPIWAATAPGIWIDRIAIVAIGLIPLWIVLYHLVRKGYRPDLPAWARHSAWRPPEEATPEPGTIAAPSTADDPSASTDLGAPAAVRSPAAQESGRPDPPAAPPLRPRPLLLGCTLVGVALLVVGLRFPPEVEPLAIDRHEAVGLAREALAERGIDLDDEWRAIPTIVSGASLAHRFVREEGGRDVYLDLLGTYLRAADWNVRFARFTGPVEERAEEFSVQLAGDDGRVRSFSHRLPEARPGPALEEEEARSLATAEMERAFGLTPDRLVEISATPTQHPARRDWSFIWSDTAAYPLDRGEARVRIQLAGDLPAGHTRFIHTPEEWDRERQAKEARLSPLRTLRGFVGFVLLGGAALTGLIAWAGGRFDRRAAAAIAAAAFGFMWVSVPNRIPVTGFGFSTTQGFGEQLLVSVGISTFGFLIAASGLGLAAGLLHHWLEADPGRNTLRSRPPGAPHPVLLGGALGLFWVGAQRGSSALGPIDNPRFPGFSSAGTIWPPLEVVISAGGTYLLLGVLVLLMLLVPDRITAGWTRRRPAGVSIFLLLGFVAAPTIVENLWIQTGVALFVGLGLLALYRLAQSWGVAFVPWLAATIGVFGLVRPLVHPPHGGARLGAILGIVLIIWLARRWSRYLESGGAPGAPGSSAEPASPADPTELTDPTNPTNPTDPIDPTDPASTASPGAVP
jgi:hypothetical protein